AVLEDLKPLAIKVGALGSADVIRELAAALEECTAPVVLDTIVSSSSGRAFLDDVAFDAFRRELIPRAALLTPNLGEALRLLDFGRAGAEAASETHAARLARACFERFGVPTLVKGGHAEGDAVDALVDGEGERSFSAP